MYLYWEGDFSSVERDTERESKRALLAFRVAREPEIFKFRQNFFSSSVYMSTWWLLVLGYVLLLSQVT